MTRRRNILFAFMSLTLALNAASQTNVATTIGEFLLIEPSSRISAMGNAGSSCTNEPMAAYYNPAALGTMTMFGAQFTHSAWLADIAYDYAIAVVPTTGSASLMLNVTSLRSGDIAVRTVEQPSGTGEYYSVSDLAFGVGYGVKVTDRISAGLQVTYMQETIWHSSMSAFGLNLGTQYRLTDNGVIIGASLSNFGSRDNFTGRDLRVVYAMNPAQHGENNALPAELHTDTYGLPILFRVGLAVPFQLAEGHNIVLVADAFHPNNNTESISVGGEYLLLNTFAVRAGYQNLFEQDSEVGLTLGAGVLIEASGTDVRLDYGWTQYGRLGDVQRLSIGMLF
ncbi:MAG TPA: PorV/PorQ family protein [Bacteroidota bacterium]